MSKTVMRTGESSPVGAACPFGLKPCPKGSGLRRVSRPRELAFAVRRAAGIPEGVNNLRWFASTVGAACPKGLGGSPSAGNWRTRKGNCPIESASQKYTESSNPKAVMVFKNI
jgi:hypothetical protein